MANPRFLQKVHMYSSTLLMLLSYTTRLFLNEMKKSAVRAAVIIFLLVYFVLAIGWSLLFELFSRFLSFGLVVVVVVVVIVVVFVVIVVEIVLVVVVTLLLLNQLFLLEFLVRTTTAMRLVTLKPATKDEKSIYGFRIG